MQIMTFNIKKFQNYHDVDLCMEEIINYIKNFLKMDRENIAIIQEMPYGIGENCKYVKAKKMLGEGYQIIHSRYLPTHTKTLVCAIKDANNKSWDLDDNLIIGKEDFSNHFLELKYLMNKKNKLKMIGIHMPLPNEKEVDMLRLCYEKWDKIIKLSSEMYKSSKPLIIAGDLNAHRHPYRNSTYQKYLSKFKGYEDCVSDEIVTCFGPQTTVDHVFCSESLNASLVSAKVERFSDHAPIIVDISSI